MSNIKCDNSLELSKFAEISTLPDFTFIIDGCEYKCKTIQICSISQVIFSQLPNFQISEEKGTEDDFKSYHQCFIYNFDEKNLNSNNQNENITCSKLKDPHHYFQLFIDAIDGKNITITKFNAFFLNYIAGILQVEELKKATEPFMTFKLNTANAIQILFYFSESNIRNNAVINYVSSNWSQFDFPIEIIKSYISNDLSLEKSDKLKLEKMLHFPYEFFDFIFSNKSFKPRNDEWLYQFIYLLVKRNKSIKNYNLLFRYVKFEKITNVDLNKVIKCIAIDSIPSNFVDSFEKRFISEIDGKVLANDDESDSEDFSYESQEEDNSDYDNDNNEANKNETNGSNTTIMEKKTKFKYEFKKLFKGVFSFFKQENCFPQNVKCYCGGTKQSLLFHVFEYDDDLIFEYYWDSFSVKKGTDIKNAWIVVTFPNHQFKLKNYTIATSPKSREFVQNGVQPKSWIVEGSNTVIEANSSITNIGDIDKAASEIEEAKWELIAKEDDNKAFLANTENIKTFGVEKKYHAFYRSFRFKMLKNNVSPDIQWYGLLKLNALEFYGTLVAVSKKKKA